MSKGPPNGFFAEGMIVFTGAKTWRVAKGFVFGPPDLHGGSVEHLNGYQEKIRAFLARLSDGIEAQFQWTGNSDYAEVLTRYFRETENLRHPHVKAVRMRVWRRLWKRMARRQLRREHLVIFLSMEIPGGARGLTRGAVQAHFEKLLGQLRRQYDELLGTLRTIFGPDTTIEPMDDAAHCAYCTRFFNPSLAERFDLNLAAQFNPALSLQENCWSGEGVGLDKIGFYLDGRYHTVLTFKRWPNHTYPGIIYRLTGLDFLDYQITVNVTSLPTRREVDKEEKAVERLRGEYESSGRHSLLVAVGKKERKIESLSTGFIRPFAVTYVIRVWDETEAALGAKCAAIKNAIHLLGGAQYYECALSATARRLFFATCPGWTGSTYQHRSLYAEDSYLADLLPFSATFTGHLEQAEALYDGAQGNVIGLRSFLGDPPSPQHLIVLGATGSGKSRQMYNFLGQSAGYFHYTVLIEEGLSYESFTKAMGGKPIILHPDGALTINYFDTDRMPLSQLQLATGVALVARMIGESADAETQHVRQAMLSHYIQQLYRDSFEEWSRRHLEMLPELQRLACGIHRWKERLGLGATDIEAFADLRDRSGANDDQAQQFLAGIAEEDITAFLNHPGTERQVMALAHAHYSRADFPTHAALVELLRFGRFPEHRKDEVDHLATLLSAWRADGQYGRLFDGPTNISLTGDIAHFELGFIPEQATQLKTAAGLLIAGFARQHIISLPRGQWKRIIYEELARFLDVEGGEKIVAESYAQLRKFNCWTASIVQQYGKFKTSRIRPVVIGNSKQFWLMRQFDRADVQDIARDIGLPDTVATAIQHYPMPEQQPPGQKFSSLCFFSPVTDPPLCGTVRNVEPTETSTDEKIAS